MLVVVNGDEASFTCGSEGWRRTYEVSGFAVSAFPLLDGRNTVDDIIDLLVGDSAEKEAELRELLEFMRAEKLLASAPLPAPGHRYDRQIRFFQDLSDADRTPGKNGASLQEDVERATVAVCGVGGLGSAVATALASMGVGALRVCDPDLVTVENLGRQTPYLAQDVGEPKVDVLARRLMEANPGVDVVAHQRRIEAATDLADVVEGAELVISCADEPTVAFMAGLVSDACWPNVPHIVGSGYSYNRGVLGMSVIPGRTACWTCLDGQLRPDHTKDARLVIRRSQQPGMISTQVSIIANIVAWEAVRLVAGIPGALTNRWSVFDHWTLGITGDDVQRVGNCRRCSGL